MARTGRGSSSRVVVLIAASILLHAACGDDDETESDASGGVAGSGAGNGKTSGTSGVAGQSQGGARGGSTGTPDAGISGQSRGGTAQTEGGSGPTEGGTTQTEGGSSPTEGGTTQTEGGSSPTEGGTTQTEGGTPSAAGAGGGIGEPCEGEVVDGECISLAPFQRVQSAKRTAGTAATSDVVTLAANTRNGNLLVLGVGVVWSTTVNTVTVPAGFTLVEQRNNTTGPSAHETAALYLWESAPALPAATGATVSVGDSQARLYLVLTEYAGLRATGALDQKASQAGTGTPSPGTTAQTSMANELWLMLAVSRGGSGHSAPSNGFALVQTLATGAGSFSFSERLVTERGMATSSVVASGDYAAIIATLRR
jgi:hypothetical protein